MESKRNDLIPDNTDFSFLNNEKMTNLLDEILVWFYYDTLDLLDLVLDDDEEDPHYSAILVIRRIGMYCQFTAQYHGEMEKSVAQHLDKITCYSEPLVPTLYQKCQQELQMAREISRDEWADSMLADPYVSHFFEEADSSQNP